MAKALAPMMLFEQYPSLLGTLIVAAIVLALQVMGKIWDRQYGTHDVMVSFMLRFPDRYSGTIWGGIWMTTSVFLGIILPIWMNNTPKWLMSPPGMIITINFSLVVPLLVLSYVSLTREIQNFFHNDNMNRIGLHWRDFAQRYVINCLKRWILLFRCAVIGITLLIIWYAILAITESVDGALCRKCFWVPWVTQDLGSKSCFLNVNGLLYYVVVRGLNTYMALGLMFLTIFLFAAFFFGVKAESGAKFFGGGTASRGNLERFVLKLSACVLLAPTIALLQGLALFLESKEGIDSELSRGVWLFFMVCSLVGTYLVLSVIVWFSSKTRTAEGFVRDEMYGNVEGLLARKDVPNIVVLDRMNLAWNVEQYLKAVRPITSINISLFLGILSAILQILGISVAVLNPF